MHKSAGTADRAEAELALARFLLDRQRREPDTRVTVADCIDAYLRDYVAQRDGVSRSATVLMRGPRLAFGTRDPMSINQDDIDRYVTRRCRGEYGPPDRPMSTVQPPTARREIVSLQAALNWASKRRSLIPGKPTFSFAKPEDNPHRDLWLTESQEREVRSRLPEASLSVQLFALMGLTYGVRRGAMLDLQFGAQVSFISGTIDFNVPGRRRTRKRRAVVPMTQEVRNLMAELFRVRAATDFVLDRQTAEHFIAFMKSIGYEWVTPHVLKHSAITLMLRGGARPADVAAAVETSLTTILGVYRHHCADEKADIFAARRA